MARLTKGVTLEFVTAPLKDTARYLVAAGDTVYAGSILIHDTTTPLTVANPSDGVTTGFAGIAMSDGVAGDTISVVIAGAFRVSLAENHVSNIPGTPVYADTSGTWSDSPLDLTTTSTDNLPIGTVGKVHAFGVAGTNFVEVRFGAQGAVLPWLSEPVVPTPVA